MNDQVAPRSVVVVGGSVAAATAVDALRQAGHDGTVTVVSDERWLPYSRPPLSKAIVKGTAEPESVLLGGAAAGAEFRLQTRATGLNVERRIVRVSDADGNDDELPYDALLIATGERARRLGANPGELVLRTLDDAITLRERASRARSVLVVGGGFLGMEVASSLLDLGAEVTVVDQVPHLRRQFGDELADRICAAASERGAALHVVSGNVELLGADHITGVRAADGSTFEADLVITAAGSLPNVEWLDGSGLATPVGVEVDEHCLVRPGIAAAGDVAARVDAAGRLRRTPHWANALDQARVAAAALIRGVEAPVYRPRPYFWTEQFGWEVKIAGEIESGARVSELDGRLNDRDALLQWAVDDRVVAAGSVNRRVAVRRLHQLVDAVPA